jgi:AraC family ethanolamine operon transcriptional activator
MQQPVTAADLCRELGVADRVLRRAFLETCGMGPMAYLRVIRLHGVRAALRSSRGSGATVAGVAEDWGFRRLGTFAAEYHRLFGERPSETLGVRGWAGVQSMSGQDRRILRAAG